MIATAAARNATSGAPIAASTGPRSERLAGGAALRGCVGRPVMAARTRADVWRSMIDIVRLPLAGNLRGRRRRGRTSSTGGCQLLDVAAQRARRPAENAAQHEAVAGRP